MILSSCTPSFAHPSAGGDLSLFKSGLVARVSRLRGNERSFYLEMPRH
jgi:hypothetical protein